MCPLCLVHAEILRCGAGKPTTQSDPMWTPRFSAPTSQKEGVADEVDKTAASDSPSVAAAALPTAVAAAETALAFFAVSHMRPRMLEQLVLILTLCSQQG